MTHEVLRLYTIHSNDNDLLCITALVDDILCTDPGSAWSDPPRHPEHSPAICHAFVDADCCDLPRDITWHSADEPDAYLCDVITDLNLDWTINN
jgi:hypothetical protein